MFNFLKKLLKSKSTPKRKILIFCGAGISAESGLITFRGGNGLWAKENIDEICNLKSFRKNKEKVFRFYNERKREIVEANYNQAHADIAEIQKIYGAENVMIFTSNIDNLLEKAGCKNVCHVHGDIFGMKCVDCYYSWDIGLEAYDINLICPHCSSIAIKPNIVFFNEPAEKYKLLNEAFESSGEIIQGNIVPNIKLLIGTSFNVLKPYIFRPNRGYSILIDPNPNIKGYEKEFKIIINKNAIEGIHEAKGIVNTLISKQ